MITSRKPRPPKAPQIHITEMPGYACSHSWVRVSPSSDPIAGVPGRGALEACTKCPALGRRDERGKLVEFDRAPGMGLDGESGEVPDILRLPLKRNTRPVVAS